MSALPDFRSLDFSRAIDISRALVPGHPNWPGDRPYTLTPAARMAAGDSVNTSVLDTSSHTGTHFDAPLHYVAGGLPLDQLPLDLGLGACLLLDCPGEGMVGEAVLDGLETVLDDLETLPPRLLLRTGTPQEWLTFPRDFRPLSPDLIRRAGRMGVRLIGTDAPSVDAIDSKTLDAHHACAEAGVCILEGLRLGHVTPGAYLLIALWLPLVGGDGSPGRAVLVPLPGPETR